MASSSSSTSQNHPPPQQEPPSTPTTDGFFDHSQNPNVVRPFGYSTMVCGYCKGRRSDIVQQPPSSSSKSYSILADSMTPTVYERFLYQGWRRSGTHLYKPANFESCCPTLTIRLPVQQFRPTKSQSKVWKKMNRLMARGSASSNNNNNNNNMQQCIPPLMPPAATESPSGSGTSSTKPVPFSKKRKLSPRKHSKTLTNSSLDVAAASKSILLQDSSSRSSSSSGLLESLRQAVLDVLPTVLTQDQREACQTLPSLSIVWKPRSANKAQQKQGHYIFACRICAILAGKFHWDRATLVTNVAQALLTRLPPGTTTTSSTEEDGAPSLVQIVAHEASGQLVATIHVPTDRSAQASSHDEESKDVTMSDAKLSPESHNPQENDDNNDNNDKLAQWYHRTFPEQPLSSLHRNLSIDLLPAHESALQPEVHQLYAHYQHVVHQDPDPFASGNNKDQASTIPNNDTTTTTTDEKDTTPPTLTRLDNLDWDTAPLYFREQIHTMLSHYIQPYPSEAQQSEILANYYSFYQFLVESPFPMAGNDDIPPSPHEENHQNPAAPDRHHHRRRPPPSFGCYHQQYRLGNILIAVGVVDILPHGLSSVYLFYHPSFSHDLVALGKFAILQEVRYTRDVLNLPYYYLGYYIESCTKMKYKADYQPSEMLCPKYYEWVPCTVAIPKLRSTPHHVCVLMDEEEEEDNETNNGKVPHGLTLSTPSTAAAPASHSTTTTTTTRNHHLPLLPTRAEEERALSHIPMDIGAGMIVTIGMLQENGQDVVRPLLQDYLRETGVALSQQCILKLN